MIFQEAFPVLPSWQLITNETAVDEFIANFEVPLPIRYYDDLTDDDKQVRNDREQHLFDGNRYY